MKRVLILVSALVALHCSSSAPLRTRQTTADVLSTYQVGHTRETQFRDYWIGRGRKQMAETSERVDAGKDYGVLDERSRAEGASRQTTYSIGVLQEASPEKVKQKELFFPEGGEGPDDIDPNTRRQPGDAPTGRSSSPSPSKQKILTFRHLQPQVEWILVFTDGILDSIYAPEPEPWRLP